MSTTVFYSADFGGRAIIASNATTTYFYSQSFGGRATIGKYTNWSDIWGFYFDNISHNPTVTTNTSLGIRTTYATLRGTLTDDGGSECDGYFSYGTTTSYGTNTSLQPISIMMYIGGLSNEVHVYRNMTKTGETTSYGDAIRDVITDDDYIYAGGDANKVFQYWISNLTKKTESADYGGDIRCLAQDDTYIYAGGLTTNKVYQYWKSNLTKKAETVSVGGTIYDLVEDDTYVYSGDSIKKVTQFWKSNLTKKAEGNYTAIVYGLTDDNTYVYAGGSKYTIYQFYKSNMTKKAESSSYGNSITALNNDDTYVYAGGYTQNNVRQYWKSNLTLKRTSTSYGGWVRSIGVDTDYIYVGGYTTNRVYQYWKSNLTKKAQTENYGAELEAVNINDDNHYFSENVTGLSPGTLYHYRAVAININGTAYGADETLLTKPVEPSGLTGISNGTVINLTWVKGTGANNTIIIRDNTSYPTSYLVPTLYSVFLYNGTGTNCSDTITSPAGETYYYSAWSYTDWSGTHDDSDAYDITDVLISNLSVVTTNNATGVEETNATLRGTLVNDGSDLIQLKENYTTNDSSVVFWGGNYQAMTFTPTTTHNITQVSMKIYKHGFTSSKTITVSIRATNITGCPTGSSLSTGTLNTSYVTSSSPGAWYNISMTNYELISGTKYAIVASVPSAGVADSIEWRTDTLVKTYAGGNRCSSSTSGVTWVVRSDDLSFREYTGGCFVKFQYGTTTSYGTNTTSEKKTTGQTFSSNITFLPGTPHHFRAVSTSSLGTAFGADKSFITKPNAPGSFTATNIPANNTQRLTWTHGTGYNRTVIRYNTSVFPSTPQTGISVYNGTNTSYYLSTPLPGQLYKYRGWEYSVWGTEHMFSDYSTIGCLTKPSAPANITASYTLNTVNFSWTKGTGANKTVIVKKTSSYPSSPTDGTVIYNGTQSYYNYSFTGTTSYLRAWSYTTWTYNPTLYEFSLNPGNLTWKVLGINVYNESKPTQALTFSLQIRNANGSEVQQYLNQTGFLFVNLTSFVGGENIYLRVWATGYQARERFFPVFENNYYNISMYLPKKTINTGEDPEGGGNLEECELRGYIDSLSVTSNTSDITIPLTHTLDSMISVEIYRSGCVYKTTSDSRSINSSTADAWIPLVYSVDSIIDVQVWNTTLYVTYGGWVYVPSDKYTYVDGNHTVRINKSVFNPSALNITIGKVSYYYKECEEGEFGAWVMVPSNKFSYTSTQVVINKTALDNTTTMARTNYYYMHCDGTTSIAVYYIRVVETIETEYSTYDRPVEGASVTFKRFMNSTGAFETMSNLLTDANGYVSIYLIPNVLYLVALEKTGYQNANSSFIPIPANLAGQTTEKIFRLILEDANYTGGADYEYLMRNITWDFSPKGYKIEGAFTFYFNITSSDNMLDWYLLKVFVYNYTTHTWQNISYEKAFNAGGGSLFYNVPNVTGKYAFELWFKKSGYEPYELGQEGTLTKFLVHIQEWMTDVPDFAYYLVILVIMLIIAGFCHLYLGTGILTGYIALGVFAIALVIKDISVPLGPGLEISGWLIFAITFILYSAGLFLWSKLT